MTIAKLSKSANTGLSMMFPYLVFPVAFALLSYAYFYRALDDIVKLTKKRSDGRRRGTVTGHIIIFLIVAIVLLLIGVPVAATLGLHPFCFLYWKAFRP